MENNELLVTETEELAGFELAEYDELDCKGGSKGKLLVGAAVVAGVTAIGGIVYHKCKDRIEAKKIEKLRKKGYVIFKEDECEVREVEDEDFEDDFIEEKSKTDEKE